jgi:hypothetical protein
VYCILLTFDSCSNEKLLNIIVYQSKCFKNSDANKGLKLHEYKILENMGVLFAVFTKLAGSGVAPKSWMPRISAA